MRNFRALPHRYLIAAALLLCAAALLPSSADARSWKSTPKDLALDYSQIVDTHDNGDVVFMWWLVPEIMENSAQGHELLDKYVIIGVAHGRTEPDGTVNFDPVTPLIVKDKDGTALKEINQADFPPTIVALVAGLQSVVTRTIGAMGQGIHWSIYKAGNVRSCAKGGMIVQYAGTDYTYDTPIPGCPPETP